MQISHRYYECLNLFLELKTSYLTLLFETFSNPIVCFLISSKLTKNAIQVPLQFHLQQDIVVPKAKREIALIKSIDQLGEWVEDNRRVFYHQFKGGLNQTYVQMIPLNRFEHYQVRAFPKSIIPIQKRVVY